MFSESLEGPSALLALDKSIPNRNLLLNPISKRDGHFTRIQLKRVVKKKVITKRLEYWLLMCVGLLWFTVN